MALQDITNVNIALETSAVSRVGFGTPLFIDAHRWFTERVRTYTSISGVAQDIPSGTPSYIAAQAFFSQNPSPAQIKLGRRQANILLTPAAPADYDVYTLTLVDTDGDSVDIEIVAQDGDDEESIVDAIISAIVSATDVAEHISRTKNGTGTATTLTLSPTSASDTFTISDVSSNLAVSATAETEAAADVLAAIEAVDTDFYVITTYDHTSSFVLAMAAAVEARSKLYFASSQAQAILSAFTQSSTDLFAMLTDLNYFRTVTLFHHTADTTYPETAFVGKCLPFDPGTITWANKQLAGVAASRDPSTNLLLSDTQQGWLADRNANLIQVVGGLSITREGKVVAGEWIDIIQSRDLLVARITEAYQNFLINSGKVPYDDIGINATHSVLISVLSRYVTTKTQPNILRSEDPFETTFPRAADVSAEDKAARVLNASFVGHLAGAIHVVNINGTLTIATE